MNKILGKAQLNPLKCNKHLSKKFRVMAFDTETKDGLRGSELFCGSFCYKDRNLVIVDTFFNLNDIYDYCMKLEEKEQKTVIFVHNLEFDIRFIESVEMMRGTYNSEKRIASGSDCLQYNFSKHVMFRDSFQFLRSSQEQAEKDYQIDKNLCKIDCKDIFVKEFETWDGPEKERLIAHNKNDVKALLAIMVEYRKNMFEIASYDVLKKVSMASYSLAVFRTTLKGAILNNNVNVEWDSDLEKKAYGPSNLLNAVKLSYRGGRTEVIRQNQSVPKAYIDINSSYPNVLKKYQYPVGKAQKLENITAPQAENIVTLFDGFISCEINSPESQHIPYILIKHNNRLVAPTGLFDCCITFFELREAMKRGYTLISVKWLIFYYETQFIFEAFIDKFYKVKEEAGKSGQIGKKECAKRLLVSLYGKFAQRHEVKRNKMKSLTNLEAQELIEQGISLKSQSVNGKMLYMSNETSVEVNVKPFLLPELSSYCCAYARHELYLIFEKVGAQYIDYFDTDSVVFDLGRYFDLELTDSKKLGDFKVEHFCNLFYAYAPKCYVLRDQRILASFANCNFWDVSETVELKCKGLVRDSIHELEQGFTSVDNLRVELQTERSCGVRYKKTKEAMARGLNVLQTKIVKKHFSLLNEKRQFDKNGDSCAKSMEDFDRNTQKRKNLAISHAKGSVKYQSEYLSSYAIRNSEDYLITAIDNIGIDSNLHIDENYERLKAFATNNIE